MLSSDQQDALAGDLDHRLRLARAVEPRSSCVEHRQALDGGGRHQRHIHPVERIEPPAASQAEEAVIGVKDICRAKRDQCRSPASRSFSSTGSALVMMVTGATCSMNSVTWKVVELSSQTMALPGSIWAIAARAPALAPPSPFADVLAGAIEIAALEQHRLFRRHRTAQPAHQPLLSANRVKARCDDHQVVTPRRVARTSLICTDGLSTSSLRRLRHGAGRPSTGAPHVAVRVSRTIPRGLPPPLSSRMNLQHGRWILPRKENVKLLVKSTIVQRESRNSR